MRVSGLCSSPVASTSDAALPPQLLLYPQLRSVQRTFHAQRPQGTRPRAQCCWVDLVHAHVTGSSGRRRCRRLHSHELELDIPDIDGDLHTVQADLEANFEGDVPATFGNDEEAAEALQTGVVIIDRSHWGRLRVIGEDRLQFLHGQSTADLLSLHQGSGCQTVFVTRTGRIVDLATCLVQGSSVLVIVSPQRRKVVRDRLEQYIFFGDKVEVQDVTDQTACFTLAGPTSEALLAKMGAGQLAWQGSHALFGVSGQPVLVSVGSGLHHPGYTIIAGQDVAADVWQHLVKQGAVPMGERGWECARILSGRPAADSELTELYSPLEAGLYSAVSVTKGCYIGQETIAKVINLDAVKQQLWGLRLSAPASPGDTITDEDSAAAIGSVTSVVDSFALGYVRCRRKGQQVALEGKQARPDLNIYLWNARHAWIEATPQLWAQKPLCGCL